MFFPLFINLNKVIKWHPLIVLLEFGFWLVQFVWKPTSGGNKI